MQIGEKWRVPVDLPVCKMTYTAQTERSFKTRFQEYVLDFKHNNTKSAIAQHVLENGHSIWKDGGYNESLSLKNKGRMLNTMENYHIYKENVAGKQIKDKQTSKSNKIFETVLTFNVRTHKMDALRPFKSSTQSCTGLEL